MNDSYFTAFFVSKGCFGGLLMGLIKDSGILFKLTGAVGDSLEPWWNPEAEGLKPVACSMESKALDRLGSLFVSIWLST